MKKYTRKALSFLFSILIVTSLIFSNDSTKVKTFAALEGGTEISISLDAPLGLCEGLKVDGVDVDLNENKVIVSSLSETRNISVCCALGKAISQIDINDMVITEVPEDVEGWITFNDIPSAESYTIKLYETESDDITMLWVYDQETAEKMDVGPDAIVENGKVEILSVIRDKEFVYNGEDDNPDVRVDEKSGFVMLKKGDDVTVKLIPDYGYQLKSVSVNEQELTPQESVSTFELRNIQGNIHFSGAFVKSEDVLSSTSEIATKPSIAEGGNAASSGNLSLTVADNESYTTDVTAVIANGTAEKIASLDLKLDNIVSKGDGNNWVTNITEFENPISISMNVSGDVLSDGETFGIVRDHNGTLTELEATYVDGVLTFKTNQFSTYTLIKKSETKIIAEEFKASDISTELKDKGFDTVEKIETKMIDVLKSNNIVVNGTNSSFVDVKIKMLKNGEWIDVNTANFPEGGLDIEIPFDMSKIPAGAKVSIAHMYGETIGDAKAGDIEILTPEITESGLKVKVKGLSPFIITWTLAENPAPAATVAPNTGDSSNVYGMLFVMFIAMISLLYFSRKRFFRA